MMFSRLTIQPLLPPVVILLFATIVVIATIWLYRGTFFSPLSAWRLAIPIVRLLAFLAIVAALLRPSVLRPKSIAEFGPLVMVIDVSRSMGVKDGGRSVGQRVELADTLRMLPSGTRLDATANLRGGVDELSSLLDAAAVARSELEFARLATRSSGSAQANFTRQVLALTNRAESLASQTPRTRISKRYNALLTEIAKASREQNENWFRNVRERLTQLSNLLSDDQAGADERLARNSDEVRRACDAVGDMSRLELVDRLLKGPGGLLDSIDPKMPVVAFTIGDEVSSDDAFARDSNSPDATADRSNLTGNLAEIRRRLQGQPRVGILMFSDGRQVGAEGDIATALGAAPTPIFTVYCAGPIKRDVAIARVVTPTRIVVGEEAAVRVDVTAIGDRVDAVPITIQLGDAKRMRLIQLKEGRGSAVLNIEALVGGIQTLVVSSPATPEESSADNNRVERHINVSAAKTRIALLKGTSGRESDHIRDVLSGLPGTTFSQYDVSSSTGTQPSSDDLLQKEVIIFCDVSPSSLGAAQWHAVWQAINERGAAAILTAGDNFIAGSTSPGRESGHEEYGSLLPFASPPPAWRTWPGDEPAFRIAPVTGAEHGSAVLTDDVDPPQSTRFWNTAAPLLRYLPMTDLKPGVLPLLAERESGAPVLTEKPLGTGRVYFLGSSETWRWAPARRASLDSDPFWPRFVRNAFEPSFALTDGALSLDVEPLVVTTSKPLLIRARQLDPNETTPGLRIDVVRSDAAADAVSSFSTSNDYARWPIEAPRPGDYRVRLTSPARAESVELPLTVESTSADELRNLNGDEGLLRRVAESSGGEFVHLEQARSLLAKIAAARERQPQFVEYPLWDSPYFFVFVVGCLGMEWSLRKRIGMA